MVLKRSYVRCVAASVLTLAAALASTACSQGTETNHVGSTGDAVASSVGPTTRQETAGLPVTVTDDRGLEVTIESIERIVAVDGIAAEIVFALGYGDQVVATDISATFPSAADELPEVGYQRSLAAEPVAALDPTLILATDAVPPETISALERLDYPVVVLPSSPTGDGPAKKIRAVGNALGQQLKGEQLAKRTEADIQAATTDIKPGTAPRVLALYVRGENVQLVLGKGSGVDWLIRLAGGVDVGTELGVIENAPLNAEAILEAKPDVLLVPERGLESVGGLEGLLSVSSLVETPAGQNRQVLVYDDQLLLGNGPRSGELLALLAADLENVVV